MYRQVVASICVAVGVSLFTACPDGGTNDGDAGSDTGADTAAEDTSPEDTGGSTEDTGGSDDTSAEDSGSEDTSADDTGSSSGDTVEADGDGGSESSWCEEVELGANGDLNGTRLFPDDSYWNKSVEDAPVDPNSDDLIASMGADTGLHADFGCCWDGGPFGIPYTVVDDATDEVPISFRYADESDPGPYPIPPDAPIEGGEDATGDRHVLALDCAERKLYELFDAHPKDGGGWDAGSGAVWDLDEDPVRAAYCTSADAAGLPVLPGLVRYDEAEEGEIDHALRFTVADTRKAFVRPPASHWASDQTSEDLPPLGMRVRLKDDAALSADGVDVSSFSPRIQAIVEAMQTYGMILADNGSDWYVSGMPHAEWSDDNLVNQLGQIKGRHFEVIEMENVVDDRSVGSGSCDLE